MARTVEIVAKGNFPYRGKTVPCEVIKFGSKLRIVCTRNDRSINNKGYQDLNSIRREFPGSV